MPIKKDSRKVQPFRSPSNLENPQVEPSVMLMNSFLAKRMVGNDPYSMAEKNSSRSIICTVDVWHHMRDIISFNRVCLKTICILSVSKNKMSISNSEVLSSSGTSHTFIAETRPARR